MKKTLKAVLFDFDGTLTQPGILNFTAIRQAIQCPSDMPILEYINTLPPGKKRDQTIQTLESFESKASECTQPHQNAEDLIAYLKSRTLKLGIITRNSLNSVITSLKKFKRVQDSDFCVIITRNDPVKPKPDPDGILIAAKKMNVPVEQIMMVGDYIFDVEAGQRAGTLTIFLDNGATTRYPDPPAHHMIRHLSELESIVEEFVLPE